MMRVRSGHLCDEVPFQSVCMSEMGDVRTRVGLALTLVLGKSKLLGGSNDDLRLLVDDTLGMHHSPSLTTDMKLIYSGSSKPFAILIQKK